MTQQIQYQDIRPSPIAGQWYPGNAERLSTLITGYLEAAPLTVIDGKCIGLVVPHAGYVYSGAIAAHAFRLVQGMAFERVVVLSPMHHLYFESILTSAHEAYQTPLGQIEIDHDTLEKLESYFPIKAIREDPEHSLEIELPFLQRALAKPFSLIPLMLRDQSYEMAKKVGRGLAHVLKEHDQPVLIVASSDLSHFYTEKHAHKLDRIMLDQIEAFDPEAVIRVEDEGKAFACGRAAIASMLIAAHELGADTAKVVGYGTSADAGGDRQRVVGYGAAVIFQAG